MLEDVVLMGVLQSLVLALVAYGVMIPFRILNFPDLTSEGTYPFGGAVCASLIILGINPIVSILVAAIAAGFVGICTAWIHLRFKVNSLLAGIILSTMLYSINLRIMHKPNIALFDHDILFLNNTILTKILIILGIIIFFTIAFALFLKTEKGLRLRAVGLNPDFAKRRSISIAKYTMLSLFIANCYNGIAGALMTQLQSYMDVGMGVGVVIHALAALMIGEVILGQQSLWRQLMSPLVGALVYQQIQGFVLVLGLAPSDLKFLTGLILLSMLAIKKEKRAVV